MPEIRRPYALIAAALVFVAVLAAGEFWPGGSSSGALPPPPRSSSAPPPVVPALVHVVGAVRRPGVYRLTVGARVQDAVRAAGGPRRSAALDQLNLAALVVDGEQVVVPRRGRSAPAIVAPGNPPVVHLNTADAAALDGLPGIGPATAARIVAFRAQHGPFARIGDLVDVPGIGPAKLEAMRPQLAL